MFDISTAQGQLHMQRAADRRALTVCRVFNEIQTGPKPLTPAEVRQLVELRPDVYGVLEAHAAPEASA